MKAVRRFDVSNWDDAPPEERYSVHVAHGGKDVPGIQSERITAVEEKVMEWTDATFVHRWFLANVLDENTAEDKPYHVTWGKLRELLSVCDKVLCASHLIPENICSGDEWDMPHLCRKALGKPAKVIKNISVAHRLLPRSDGPYEVEGDYDEAYLNSVNATRDWIIRMFAEKNDVRGSEIYYSFSRYW